MVGELTEPSKGRIKGHGTVVTGTAIGAEVKVGQKLRVLPENHEVRVRSIQVHSESVPSAGLCQRVALNLSGDAPYQRRCIRSVET